MSFLETAGLRALRKLVRPFGYDVCRSAAASADRHDRAILDRVRPFTMTSDERLLAVCDAVRYVVRSGVPGDVVECGVWRGGSSMAAALTLLDLGETDRQLHLFDTFQGMSAPAEKDRNLRTGASAADLLSTSSKRSNMWAVASIDDVRRNLVTTGYPPDRLSFVEGKVEQTIPAAAPVRIAILRLDTDWYESTRHELEHLYPRLSPGGVLIIDDYGEWEGARTAVDEYLERHRIGMLLHRIDYTGRIGIKPG